MSDSLHQPLKSPNSIRLLHLTAAKTDAALHMELTEVDLKDVPCYHAMSYTWGAENTHCLVEVNGVKIYIRQNLYNFLLQLRRHNHAEPLWVDAISISQSDLAEKGAQVALIGEIFRSAKSVLAWVGEHSDDSQFLFQPWVYPPHTAPSAPLTSEKKTPIWTNLWFLVNKAIDITHDE